MSMSVIVILILLSLLSVSVYFAFKFAMILLRVEDALEKSLDVLDSSQESISEILERPLFLDSPEVRKVHADIVICRDSILEIAYSLTSNVSSREAGEAELEKEEN